MNTQMNTQINTRTKNTKTKTNRHIQKTTINCGSPLIKIVRNNIAESIHSGHLLILD